MSKLLYCPQFPRQMLVRMIITARWHLLLSWAGLSCRSVPIAVGQALRILSLYDRCLWGHGE